MQRMPFIFSSKWTFVLARHLAFWLIASLGLGLLGLGIRPLFGVEITPGAYKEHVLQPLLYLPGELLLVYTLLYWIIPRFVLTRRYFLAAAWSIALVILSGLVAATSYDWLRNPSYAWIASLNAPVAYKAALNHAFPPDERVGIRQNLPFDFLFALRAILNVAGFAAALKLAKHWYEKEYLNSILQREKIDAELQSLKAQLQPHFLFNTLNNIYSVAEQTSPLASDMLVKLSALLRYILYECNRPQVPLDHEFTLIRDYIALEKIRYSNLDCNMILPVTSNGYTIAPLLLLPLVENCFKHGTSKMLDQPWVNIESELTNSTLSVKLINGKLAGPESGSVKEGIGLANLRKRLDLLYPGKHQLSIISEPDIFVVNLKLQLNTAAPIDE